MFSRVAALLLLVFAVSSTRAQEVFNATLGRAVEKKSARKVENAWLDLRQIPSASSKPQTTPEWVEAISIVPGDKSPGLPEKTVFRIRLDCPSDDSQVLFSRLFFDDNAEQKPQLVAWDESGTVVMQSGPLGAGIGLSTSESVMIPMVSASTIDIEVPGNGSTVRGAYLDWMANTEVLHPTSAEHRDLIPEPFGAAAPLHPVTRDTERFGTVTAALADGAIRIGARAYLGTAFSLPRVAASGGVIPSVASLNIASPGIL